MKRSGISRGTKGFKPRATALSRRGALQRGAEMSRKATTPKPAKTHVWPKGLRDFVLDRAGGRCDMCGKPLPYRWECHHRRLLAQGGTDDPTNLLALDYPCHAEALEERTWARDHGYIVHRGTDPAERPVWRHGRVWQLPTADGWTDCDPPNDITPTEKRAAMSVRKFRKRPVVIEAVQWTGDNPAQVRELTGDDHFAPIEDGYEHESGNPEVTATVLDDLHDTWVGVKTGQWVIKGVKGEFYPIADDVLADTYEPAEDAA